MRLPDIDVFGPDSWHLYSKCDPMDLHNPAALSDPEVLAKVNQQLKSDKIPSFEEFPTSGSDSYLYNLKICFFLAVAWSLERKTCMCYSQSIKCGCRKGGSIRPQMISAIMNPDMSITFRINHLLCLTSEPFYVGVRDAFQNGFYKLSRDAITNLIRECDRYIGYQHRDRLVSYRSKALSTTLPWPILRYRVNQIDEWIKSRSR